MDMNKAEIWRRFLICIVVQLRNGLPRAVREIGLNRAWKLDKIFHSSHWVALRSQEKNCLSLNLYWGWSNYLSSRTSVQRGLLEFLFMACLWYALETCQSLKFTVCWSESLCQLGNYLSIWGFWVRISFML